MSFQLFDEILIVPENAEAIEELLKRMFSVGYQPVSYLEVSFDNDKSMKDSEFVDISLGEVNDVPTLGLYMGMDAHLIPADGTHVLQILGQKTVVIHDTTEVEHPLRRKLHDKDFYLTAGNLMDEI